MIPLSIPTISGNEWKYVKECLDTGWISSVGAYVEKFEDTVKDYVGSKYSVAVVNGTSALHLSLRTSGVQHDDEVIVPTLTFIAPVNVIKYCSANPVFMDCDPDTLCIDVNKISDFINNECEQRKDGFTYNKKTKKKIGAIILVHIFGHPVDIEPLLTLSKKYNIPLIEDAAESIGSEYKNQKTGTFGDLGCFSFNGNKIVTTGGGGIVVTDDANLARRIKHLSTQAKNDSIEYDHDEIGYNYRLTNLQGAMGVAQMERISEFLATKRKNALLYKELLDKVDDIEFMWEQTWAKSNFWFYTVKAPKKKKKALIEFLLSKNIQVRPIWKLIDTLPMYSKYQSYKIEHAQACYESCINLPCSLNLKEKEIEFITKNIENYFG
tara:strand:+ start:7187 stop:8326 length:1140 start_codon:yes stop_codon:yes gene_type:complete